jgi:tRNA(fMet)-specific endonuclease VapC
MKYLIDTTICIYIINNHPPEVVQKFRKIGIGEVGVSSITVSELYYGICKSSQTEKNTQRVEEFLQPFTILPYDEKASREYGKIRYQLERMGKIIGPLDMLIAAHALSDDLVLITNNVKKFNRIKSLRVENWVS